MRMPLVDGTYQVVISSVNIDNNLLGGPPYTKDEMLLFLMEQYGTTSEWTYTDCLNGVLFESDWNWVCTASDNIYVLYFKDEITALEVALKYS